MSDTGRERPHPMRFVSASALVLASVGCIVSGARATAHDPFSASGLLVAVVGAPVAIVMIGSLYEWLVHRFVYHGPSPIGLWQSIYEIHQRGHHWHRFPPDHYVESGPVERIPVWPAEPRTLCGSPRQRAVAWGAQYALYLFVGVPLAFVPAWFLTQNALFTTLAVVSGLTVCALFIRVHDVIHYPRDRWVEGLGAFRFLDRHHYIHHIDTRANLNFLLPLCDWLFGTLRLSPTEEELRRWPTFEEAKRLEAQPAGRRAAA